MQKWLLTVALLIVATSTEGAGEFSGFVAGDIRIFANSPAFPEQRAHALSPSLLVQPEYRYEWNDGKDRLTAVPFARLEYDDKKRRHFDLRELHWLHAGPTWDLLFGVGKVFWGVTESRHLVDIINQTDLVEDPDAEDKLGQPLLKLALLRPWGTVTLFALPRFRERTFPGRKGRLRGRYLWIPTSLPMNLPSRSGIRTLQCAGHTPWVIGTLVWPILRARAANLASCQIRIVLAVRS